jgi:hypothetical protein
MAVALLLALVTAPPSAGSPAPRITRDPSGIGFILPGSLWLSGDVTLAVDVPEHRPVVAEMDDIRLLARYEALSRLAFFGELRFEDLVEVVEGKGLLTEDAEVVIERLYAEALLTPQLSLRLGKVFTPFGLWNVISRAPLTWTVEEPAITESETFPRRVTGLSLLYQKTWQGWTFDATAYGPAGDEIRFRRSDAAGLLFGGRVAAGRALGPAFASLGLNAAGFRSHAREIWTTATGLDLAVSVGGHEIMSEYTHRMPASGPGTEQGLYVQDAIPLFDNLYGVLRFEYLQPPRGRAAVGQLVGLFWRPAPNVILKADYLFGTRRSENFSPGFQASFSFLF